MAPLGASASICRISTGNLKPRYVGTGWPRSSQHSLNLVVVTATMTRMQHDLIGLFGMDCLRGAAPRKQVQYSCASYLVSLNFPCRRRYLSAKLRFKCGGFTPLASGLDMPVGDNVTPSRSSSFSLLILPLAHVFHSLV
jgi:hypothetical protein